ncbi:MAG: hypothetical protein KDA16_05835 [Phycisphaerales bacterium]|nr:hypothetical protein [Phycisphaerales bacterium]
MPNTAPPTVDRDLRVLPRLGVNANWKLPPARQPHLLVHDIGPEIDRVFDSLVGRIHQSGRPGVAAGQPVEMRDIPGQRRCARFVSRFQPGHVCATDVILSREGDDLYVVFGAKPRTRLAYLHFALRGLAMLTGVCLLLWLYLGASGARTSWIKDYADKHASIAYGPGQSEFMARRLEHGSYVIDWQKFTSLVMDDPETVSRLYDFLGRIQQSSPWHQFGLSDLSAAMRTGRHMLQPHLMDVLAAQYGDGWYAWWIDGRAPITQDLGLGSIGLGAMETDSYPVTFVELIYAQALRAAFRFDEPQLDARLSQALDASTWRREPVSLLWLTRHDPRTALFNIGLPVTIASGIVGFGVIRAPRSWLRYPCRLLRWITPDDFDTRAVAHTAWIEREFSKALAEYGIGRSMVTELQGGGNVRK